MIMTANPCMLLFLGVTSRDADLLGSVGIVWESRLSITVGCF